MAILRTLLLLPAFAFVGGLALLAWNGSAFASAPPANPRKQSSSVSTSRRRPVDPRRGSRPHRGTHQPMIAALPPHSRVLLRSFGAYNSAANNTLSLDVVIAPKTARAEDMARLIGGVIGGLPQMVRGRVQVQNSTNIVPF
jgi:hypothetical protein